MQELTAYRTERDVDRPTQPAGSSATLVVTPPLRGDPERPPVAQIAREVSLESRRRERRLRRALALVDILALATALLVPVTLASPDALHPSGLLLFPALVAAAKLFGLYDSDDQRIRKTTAEELPRLAQLGTLVVLAIWLGDRLLIGGPAGKMQSITVGLIFVAVASIGRRTARRAASHGVERERCLLVGDRISYQRLATIFERHHLSSSLVGYTPLEQVLDAVRAAPGSEVGVLRELIAAERVHRIIIGPHAMSNAATFELLEAARGAGARVSLLPDMLEVVGSSVDFDDLYGVTLLGVRHADLSRSSQWLKRAFDVVGATLVLVATAPAMAMIAIAIRLDSRGPVLFCQPRIGRAGEPFRIFKFRTMQQGADRLKDGLRELNEAEGLFKITDDPRITRIGRALRRTSLDELPQLFNVLLGQMSLVGPRPLVADEDGRILGAHRGRLRLTPGMTGQWQISGSARVPLEEMVKLDHLYVSNWTLWGDLKILLRTVPYVLSRSGR
ncbi:MAG TPA: exopolysaccharide biosynthesis polyprenyl glycosylphosphotransferase [Solirubrobacteraceae bacterium]|nr:exopolysaccharide biosynthesis polyprenyl glycosylphosphotransferase [Solirubrobacteraceae bacterium]